MRKHSIFPLLTSIICLISCNSMDNEPTGSYLGKNFWTSLEKAQYVLNMAYNQLYNASRMWSDEWITDNFAINRAFTDERIIRMGNAEPTTGKFDSEWSDCYGTIKTCNIFLDMIDLTGGDKDEIKKMKAQARYIRAAEFFRLTNLYGDVPYFTHNISADEAKAVSRTAHECVIDSIRQELTNIINLLPSKDELTESQRGMITKGTVMMLLTRTYLYEADWEHTIECCQKLMEEQSIYGYYSLFNDFAALFLQTNEYNNEIIFDCGYAPKMRTWNEMFDMAPLSVGARVNGSAPTQSLVDDFLMLDGLPFESSPLYDESTPYSNRDPRLTHTIIYDQYDWSTNINDGTTGKIIYTAPNSSDNTDAYAGHNKNQTCTGYYVRKYYDPNHEDNLASAINIITMRYADVLLMYAEAMNELGRMSKDVWDDTIRPIRKRAGFTESNALEYPTTATQEQLRQIIRRERRCELAFEGLRWYDIKRWRIGEKCLNGYVRGAKFENNMTEYITLDLYTFDDDKDYLWAVPQAQIDINANLKPQNPGY